MSRLDSPKAEPKTELQVCTFSLLGYLFYVRWGIVPCFYILILSFNIIKILRKNNNSAHSCERCHFYTYLLISLYASV